MSELNNSTSPLSLQAPQTLQPSLANPGENYPGERTDLLRAVLGEVSLLQRVIDYSKFALDTEDETGDLSKLRTALQYVNHFIDGDYGELPRKAGTGILPVCCNVRPHSRRTVTK